MGMEGDKGRGGARACPPQIISGYATPTRRDTLNKNRRCIM